MPKPKTKFIANVVTKIGKTKIEIKVPIDFTQTSPDTDTFDSVATAAHDTAAMDLSDMVEGATLAIKNKGDLKKAYKAYAKSVAP